MTIEIIIDGTTHTLTKKELFDFIMNGKVSSDTPVIVNGKLLTAKTSLTMDSNEAIRPPISISQSSVPVPHSVSVTTVKVNPMPIEYPTPQSSKTTKPLIGVCALLLLLASGMWWTMAGRQEREHKVPIANMEQEQNAWENQRKQVEPVAAIEREGRTSEAEVAWGQNVRESESTREREHLAELERERQRERREREAEQERERAEVKREQEEYRLYGKLTPHYPAPKIGDQISVGEYGERNGNVPNEAAATGNATTGYIGNNYVLTYKWRYDKGKTIERITVVNKVSGAKVGYSGVVLDVNVVEVLK